MINNRNKLFKRLLNVLIYSTLIGDYSFAFSSKNNGTTDTILDRNKTEITNYLYNAHSTKIPYASYSDDFINQTTKILDQFNLKKYNGKYIYAGYGVFDKNNNYCKYVELPSLNPVSNPSDNIFSISPANFDKTTLVHFQNHSYAKSLNTMTYEECSKLANKFGGYPVVINSPIEDTFIQNKMGNNYWLGITRKNCNSPYINAVDEQQDYNPFLTNSATPMCNDNHLNLFVNEEGEWQDTSKQSELYCVIEVNTPDIKKPLKICAPWWRVERTYKIDTKKNLEALAGGLKLNYINQADIPKLFTLCTKYDDNATTQLEDSRPREVTCTQYYQATAAPECLRDPFLPECHINECEGYIQNACNLVKTVTPFKNYTKSQAIINGKRQWIKDKQQIKTYIYQCPPSLPSIKKCLKQEMVLEWPKECPGSECEAYKKCILSHAGNSTKIQEECRKEYKCEKIYPNPDLIDPSCYNDSGELIKMKGRCSDGTILSFPINVQNRVNKKCIQYEELNITKKVNETCNLHRNYTDHTVDMSITDEDIYQNNPNCIRTNNVISARPPVQVVVSYKSFGTSKVNIIKAYIDRKSKLLASTPEINNYAPTLPQIANEKENFFKGVYGKKPSGVDQAAIDENKKEYSCDFNGNWISKISKYTELPHIITIEPVHKDSTNVIKLGYEGEMVLKFQGVSSSSECANDKNKANGNGYYYSSSDKYCEVYTNKTDSVLDNRFGRISIYNGLNGQTWYSKNAVNKSTCNNWAACLNVSYNVKDFPTDSSFHQCILNTETPYKDPNPPKSNIETKAKNMCKKLTQSNGSTLTDINGLKDIFAITDETSGNFGFFSNYARRPYKDSEAFINGKEVMPIMGVAHIRDDQIKYYYNLIQHSYLTKHPNLVAAFIAGGAVGAASVTYVAAGAWAIAPAAYLAAAIFGRKTQLNRQQEAWVVYKMVPTKIYNTNNFYGYDERVKLPYSFDRNNKPLDATFGHNGESYYAMVYLAFGTPLGGDYNSFNQPIRWQNLNDTGTMRPGDFGNTLTRWKNQKTNEFQCTGFDEVATPLISAENGVVVGYPSCKWYKLSCNKENAQSWGGTKNLFKDMTNIYQGATNTLSIVVPYTGDYEVKAFDKYGNTLGDSIVKESNFIDGGAHKAKYTQIMFGLNMNLAKGIDEGTENKACRNDNMVEWGGGISGIYYENDYTGLYKGCEKSNDEYVLDHSATEIKVRPLNQNNWYVIKLDKPLPFANRVFLVTLAKKEIRKYRCFSPFSNCKTNDWLVDKKQ